MVSNDKKTKIMGIIAYIYLLLPFLIFAVGWFGKRYWIPIVPILVFCCYRACRDSQALWRPTFDRDTVVKMLFIILIIAVWVYFSGIGRLVFQNADHNCRNAVYETLVNYDWPVVNLEISEAQAAEGVAATSLIYYIGFWLPAAVVGKIFGMEAGYGFQVFWAILGIVLVYYLICARKEKIMLWPLLVLIFFSGMDIVGQYFRGVDLFTLPNDMHLEWWIEPYQYSSMTTQLFWVFNQAVPAWLCTMLAYMQKNNRSMVFILALCMLPGTFPFVGLLVLVLYWMFTRDYGFTQEGSLKERLKRFGRAFVRDTFTIQNVLGGGIIGIFSFLYLSANLSGSRFMQESIHGAVYDNHLLKYIFFILVEVGAYLILLYKYNRNSGFYYVLLFSLLVIPPIKVGSAGDFCMRVSIPALFMLMLLVMDALERAKKEQNRCIFVSLIVVLCIGSVTPIHEIVRTFKYSVERINAQEQVYESTLDSVQLLNSPNFSGDVKDSFFFKYIAR